MTNELNGPKAVTILRAKAAQLEHTAKKNLMYDRVSTAIDIALLCNIMAAFIERTEVRLASIENDIAILSQAEEADHG